MKTIVAGIDAGSTAIKIALYDGQQFLCRQRPASWSPREEAQTLLAEITAEWYTAPKSLAAVIGTGYGRVSLTGLTKAMTEITCHGKGASHLVPGARTVIDIGGQDSKVIRIGADKRVEEFLMNDKCAAGTGRFLQVMNTVLGFDFSQASEWSLSDTEVCKINSMCTVFAESEVIGLLNKGVAREAIVAGIYQSIASRIGAMAGRLGVTEPVVFTGGLSRLPAIHQALETELRCPIIIPDLALYAGAVGAALFAWEQQLIMTRSD